jgi:hypothetical protein
MGGMGGSPGCPVGFSCVAEIAAGEYAISAPGSEACPMGWGGSTTVADGVDPGCTACSCGAPANGTCDPGTAHRVETAACTGAENTFPNNTDGQCVDINTGASGFFVEPSAPDGGACEPSMSSPVPLGQSTVCTAPAGMACGAGMVCVPDTAAPFGDACNLLTGDVMCPAGWPSKVLVHDMFVDTRMCDCNCGDPQSPACMGAQIQLFNTNNCSNAAVATIPADGMCVDTAALSSNSSFLVEAGTWSAASCASQDNHSGGVAFSGDLTLCCAP